MMLKIPNLLFSVIIITIIILFSGNLVSDLLFMPKIINTLLTQTKITILHF